MDWQLACTNETGWCYRVDRFYVVNRHRDGYGEKLEDGRVTEMPEPAMDGYLDWQPGRLGLVWDRGGRQ